MPYSNVNDLPENIRSVLPDHAQEIFKKAFNNAYEEYKDPEDRRDDSGREDTARKVAWAAAKKSYEKGTDGSWHQKD